MDSDPQAQRGTVIPPAGEAGTRSEQSQGLDAQLDFDSVSRDGWAVIGRCRSGKNEAGDDTGCFVLAHGEIGVALVDVAPCETPNAEGRLRRMLNAAGFEFTHRGFLPVVHLQVRPEEAAGLGALLDQAFAAELPLSIERGAAWFSTLRKMLQAGVTWEGIGRKGASLPRYRRGNGWRSGDRSILPAGIAAVNLVVTFGLGFLVGILCLPPSDGRLHAAHRASGIGDATTATRAGGVVLPASSEPSDVLRQGRAETPPTEMPADALRPAETTAALPEPSSPMPEASQQPAGASAGRLPELSMTGGEAPLEPIQAALPQESSGTHPVAPQPSRRAMRASFAIDRRCTDAVFRYQQGASLSWTEMGYIRNGCQSWR